MTQNHRLDDPHAHDKREHRPNHRKGFLHAFPQQLKDSDLRLHDHPPERKKRISSLSNLLVVGDSLFPCALWTIEPFVLPDCPNLLRSILRRFLDFFLAAAANCVSFRAIEPFRRDVLCAALQHEPSPLAGPREASPYISCPLRILLSLGSKTALSNTASSFR